MTKAQLQARVVEYIRDCLVKSRALKDFQFIDGKIDTRSTQEITFTVTYVTELRFELMIRRHESNDSFAAVVDFDYSDVKSQEIKAVAKLCDFVENRIDKAPVLEYMNELLQRRFRRGAEL